MLAPLDHLQLSRSRNSLGSRLGVQLVGEVVNVCLGRVDADDQPLGYLAVRETIIEQSQDLEFALAQDSPDGARPGATPLCPFRVRSSASWMFSNLAAYSGLIPRDMALRSSGASGFPSSTNVRM